MYIICTENIIIKETSPYARTCISSSRVLFCFFNIDKLTLTIKCHQSWHKVTRACPISARAVPSLAKYTQAWWLTRRSVQFNENIGSLPVKRINQCLTNERKNTRHDYRRFLNMEENSFPSFIRSNTRKAQAFPPTYSFPIPTCAQIERKKEEKRERGRANKRIWRKYSPYRNFMIV